MNTPICRSWSTTMLCLSLSVGSAWAQAQVTPQPTPATPPASVRGTTTISPGGASWTTPTTATQGLSGSSSGSAYPGPSSLPGSSTSAYPGSGTAYPGTTDQYGNPIPGTTSYPGSSSSYPGSSTSYPGASTSYPGSSTSYPGVSTSYPGASTSYPGSTTTYPGSTSAYPGSSSSYPGTNDPYGSSYPSSNYPGGGYSNNNYPSNNYPSNNGTGTPTSPLRSNQPGGYLPPSQGANWVAPAAQPGAAGPVTAAGGCSLKVSTDRAAVSLVNRASNAEFKHVAMGEVRVQKVFQSSDGEWAVAVYKLRGESKFGFFAFNLAACQEQLPVDLPTLVSEANFEGPEVVLTLEQGPKRFKLANGRF